MNIYSVTYPAKCKHCHFHFYVQSMVLDRSVTVDGVTYKKMKPGKRMVGICRFNRQSSDFFLHPDDKRKSENDKSCDNFKLPGVNK